MSQGALDSKYYREIRPNSLSTAVDPSARSAFIKILSAKRSQLKLIGSLMLESLM
jgi:hypothetical protein